MVNVDVAGDELGRNELVVLGTPRLQGYAEGITRELGHFFRSSLDVYSSDCMPFATLEIPSVSLARDGGESSSLVHTPGDRAERTSARGLAPSAEAAVGILDRVLNAVIYPVDREIERSLKERIEKYLWGSRLEKPELDWTPEYRR